MASIDMPGTGRARLSLPPPNAKGVLRGSLRLLLGRMLMYVVVFEAAVMGSGQILHLGPVTVKMMLFTISMAYVVGGLLAGDRIRMSTAFLVVSYVVTMALAAVIGLSRGAEADLVWTDISPMLSFLLLPFFEMTIRTPREVAVVVRILMMGAAVLVAAYIYIVLTLWTGRTTYADLVVWLGRFGNGDFIFDQSSGRVFYKGAIYLGVALYFFLFKRRWWAWLCALLVTLSLVVTGTRGFFLALFATLLLYVLIGPMRTTRKLAIFLPILVAGTVGLGYLFLLAGNKGQSNRDRVETTQQVVERTELLTVIAGNGLGIGVPIRPVHMEITYMEILFKQGIIGISWWCALLGVLLVRFRRALRRGDPSRVYPFFLASMFIALESFTNPFIDNPIGMTFVTLSLAAFRVFESQNAPEEHFTAESAAQPA